MSLQYLVWVGVLTLILSSCTTSTPPAPSAFTTSATPAAASTPTASPATRGLASPIPAHPATDRRWYTVPSAFDATAVRVSVTFDGDPSDGDPYVSLEGGRDVPLARTGAAWSATVSLDGVAPGERRIAVFERLRDTPGVANVGVATFVVSQPEYVVWTLDFEGDAASDAAMAETSAIADGMKVPMTVLWNPRAWTTPSVSGERAAAMLAWTKDRAAKGDEVGLHLHMWTDYVAAAGVAPHLLPRWAGRSDGYDVPITSYSEEEQKRMIEYGLRLMADQGIGGVTSFRAGGDIGDATTLRALVANGITADCTAVAAGTFGSLRLPWTLARDAQPYVPSKDDANKPGELPILEAPTNGGNTYGYTTGSIAPIARANVAMLAKPGEATTQRRGIVVVSHPGTIDPTERAAIEALFHAFDPYRYDQDKGPVRFVTLRQLAQAWR